MSPSVTTPWPEGLHVRCRSPYCWRPGDRDPELLGFCCMRCIETLGHEHSMPCNVENEEYE